MTTVYKGTGEVESGVRITDEWESNDDHESSLMIQI